MEANELLGQLEKDGYTPTAARDILKANPDLLNHSNVEHASAIVLGRYSFDGKLDKDAPRNSTAPAPLKTSRGYLAEQRQHAANVANGAKLGLR
jgi:hypothetical protein